MGPRSYFTVSYGRETENKLMSVDRFYAPQTDHIVYSLRSTRTVQTSKGFASKIATYPIGLHVILFGIATSFVFEH